MGNLPSLYYARVRNAIGNFEDFCRDCFAREQCDRKPPKNGGVFDTIRLLFIKIYYQKMGFALCDALSVSLPMGYFDFGFAYAQYNDTFHSVIPRKRLRGIPRGEALCSYRYQRDTSTRSRIAPAQYDGCRKAICPSGIFILPQAIIMSRRRIIIKSTSS